MKHLARLFAIGSLLTASLPFAHAASCTVAPQGPSTSTLDFCGGSFTPYTEYGYTITDIGMSTWEVTSGGDPTPSLNVTVTGGRNGDSPEIFQINNNDGGAFLFDDLYLATGDGKNINYTITGFNADGSTAWTTGAIDFTGVGQNPNNVCPANYSVGTGSLCYSEITAADTAYASYVQVSVSAGVDPVVYVDNLSVTQTPEPSSLLLLGTGLAGACGVLYRKGRALIA